MKKNIFTLIILLSMLTSNVNAQWAWEGLGTFDYGLVYWNSDLGSSSNFTTGINGTMYNTNDANSPIVLNGRVYYMHFFAEDAHSRITREMVGVSAGAGLHMADRLFGTVNVGHLWVVNLDSDGRKLSSLLASVKLMAIVLKMQQRWNLSVSLEGGMTFQDIEFRDPPVDSRGFSPDQYTGTGFIMMTVGFTYDITGKSKSKSSSSKKSTTEFLRR